MLTKLALSVNYAVGGVGTMMLLSVYLVCRCLSCVY